MPSLEELTAREEDLRRRAAELPDDRRRRFYAGLKKESRDPDTYAVLNYLFVAGLHHFYLERWARGATNLAVFLLGVGLFFGGVAWLGLLLIAAITVIELPALFRAQEITREYNLRLMERLLSE